MLKIEVIAVGRLKRGPLFELVEEYEKRLKWSLRIHQIESRYNDSSQTNIDENQKILEKIDPDAFVVVMDERGGGLRSLDFAQTMQTVEDNGSDKMQFIIGGADGLSEEMRDRANLLLSFGQQTWPHMLARVMLLEQIYRAQQILAGHPYHRE